MELKDYIDLNDDIQDKLFKSMNTKLFNVFLNKDYISAIMYNSFIEIGIKLNDYTCEYIKDEKKFLYLLNIRKDNVNIQNVIENLFLYSIIPTDEYYMLKEEFCNNELAMDHIYIDIEKSNVSTNVIFLTDLSSPVIQYIFETTIDELLSIIICKIEKEIEEIVYNLTNCRIYVFKEYQKLYDIDLLYSNIKNENKR